MVINANDTSGSSALVERLPAAAASPAAASAPSCRPAAPGR